MLPAVCQGSEVATTTSVARCEYTQTTEVGDNISSTSVITPNPISGGTNASNVASTGSVISKSPASGSNSVAYDSTMCMSLTSGGNTRLSRIIDSVRTSTKIIQKPASSGECCSSTLSNVSTKSTSESVETIEIIVPTVEELMTDQRNLPCTVKGCGKILATPPALRMHLNKSHAIYENPHEKSLFNCKWNSKATVTNPVKKQFYCPVPGCPRSVLGDKPFTKISLLKQHYVGIHAEKKFGCSKCSARFGMEKLLARHEESCGTIYKCATCSCGYTSRQALWSHVKYQQHQLPADFLLRPLKHQQKEVQKQRQQRQKQERAEQRKQEQHVVKAFLKQIEGQRNELSKDFKIPKDKPVEVLPKMPSISAVYAVQHSEPAVVSIGTQTGQLKRSRGPSKNSIPTIHLAKKPRQTDSTVIQFGGHEMTTQASVSSQRAVPMSDAMQDSQSFQDSAMNTSLVSASNIETQTSAGGLQSTHTCTQTQGDVIVRNALLSANIETQTSSSHTQLVQSSTQYSSMYSAASAETQTARLNLSLHSGPLFDLDVMSGPSTSHSASLVPSHPAVQTQTSMTNVASSDAQTDSWLSALYETPLSNSPGPDSPASALTQPADVPTQTDLSFLDMLNFSHSETQTMNSLASFMTESSSTQTPCIPNSSNSSSTSTTDLQSTEAQTQMGGLAGPLPLNTSQTQTSFADLCLGDVFLSETPSQTSPGVPFRLDDSLSSSHRETQTGSLTMPQSTQTAAEKELDAALSLLNQYTQTSQTNLGSDSPRPDSLSELGFTSMHTQTMQDVLAVLDNDNQSTSVQTDFGSFTNDHRSFGVSTESQPSSSGAVSNSVQTDTLDLSSFQDLDFYTSTSSSSQTS